MLGAIAGDVIGSTYEFIPWKSKEFDLFPYGSKPTDDSILTLAVASWLLDGDDLVNSFQIAVATEPNAGWGGFFRKWANARDPNPYNSFGNGSAMRVSPVGFAFPTLEVTLDAAARSAEVTHNHPEGIKGAQATAAAIFLARTGSDKATIRREIESRFKYDLSRTVDEIRETYSFDETCQGSVPEAIVAFLDSTDFEDAIRNAVSLNGDSDTQACIAGGIAQAFYGGVPQAIRDRTLEHLKPWMVELVERFEERYMQAVRR